MNGDGCPGTCGQELPGLSDHDKDGYPSAREILYGFDPFDERKPFVSVDKKVDTLYPKQALTRDPEAEAAATVFCKNGSQKPCTGVPWIPPVMMVAHFTQNGMMMATFFCDEDGGDQSSLVQTCAYNDADCDGKIDEDSAGLPARTLFGSLPDIQAKTLVETMMNPTDIFQKPRSLESFIRGYRTPRHP